MSDVPLKFGFTCQQLINDGFLSDCIKIDVIKGWLGNEKLPPLSNEQIVLFLLSCDNDIEFTKVTIKAYFRIRYGNCDVFNNRRLRSDDVQKALDVGSVCVWPQKTKDGYAIIQYKFKSSDYWKWDIKSAIKLVFMTIEMAIFDYPARGLIILVDLENMSAGHLIRLRPQSVKLFFEYLQEALPVKLKFFHVLNSPSFLNQLISIILPLMHKEIFEKMRFHPKNIDWEDFYEQYVPKEALSKDYGGDLPCSSEIEKSTLQKLIEMEEFFDTEEVIRQNNR